MGELRLSFGELAPSTQITGDQLHTTFLIKKAEAIALGHQLEKAVLANQFNPLPGHPIHRLYMEEVFSCGAHAVGAVHAYDGTNAGVKWLLPDPTGHPSPAPSATPTHFPTSDPTFTPTEVPTVAPTEPPTEIPTTMPPTTDKPTFLPTVTPTEPPTPVPTRT